MSTDSRGPIRVGLVGLGRAGWGMHIPEMEAFPDKFRLVAACDPIKERRDLVAAKTGCRTYRRYEDLLADGDVELVDIATRSDDHFTHALEALRTRRWVLLEKPMTLDHEQALKLRAAAIKASNRLYIRHNRRFEPGFVHVREIIASGRLGEVYEIRLRRGGFQRRDDWQTVKRCGGGQLLNWGPHLIDHALQFLGTPPTHMWSDLKRVAAVGDAEDLVHIILRNADGLTVDLEISGGTILPQPECVVTGTRGALSLQGEEIFLRYLDPAQKIARRRASVRTPPLNGFGSQETLKWTEARIPVKPAAPASMNRIWECLHASIRLNKPFPVTLDQSVEVMRIISSARKDTPYA